MSVTRYRFSVPGCAVPAINGRRERIPAVKAWQQEILAALDEQLHVRAFRSIGSGARMEYQPPLAIPPGGHGRIEAWFRFKPPVRSRGDGCGLLKALEDALFSQDRELLDGEYHVDRRADVDGVVVDIAIYPASLK